ncbi:alpha-hydroxy-acid oxidizing enzyme [Prauserella marina]|uniref:L-lactate dehydrogenase (Cytochrome) n=1 Tax=Prauserella marina TaxID=530584 RepID=A0A222VML3_9PSEU|nr:lactate 2-monooxygenase [Prauserella marina]ASR35155.1 alpha-hydroxy-acid oxidizing enzyme [Prauserella marina]PWV85083.1 L-lactate dehydrogenase (cytochrome) [Prauserella marina]SDC05178.1 L-lactate dehydrogenase (cytochrome) [Prauserella marina]
MSERFGNYQAEIYLQGYGGTTPAFSTDLTRIEESAAAVLDPRAYGYVAGSAGSGSTAAANRAAFDRWRLVPRMLAGATERDLTTTVLGTTMPAPVLLAPVGAQSIVHDGAEAATARAAASTGLPMVLSTASSTSIEDVAAASGGGPLWFQLYWPSDSEVCLSLLARAEAAGYSVLVVTLDNWSLGWRPSDLDNGYLPFLNGAGTAVPFTDPVFLGGLDASPEEEPAMAVLRWISMITGTDRTWADLAFLRKHWEGPIVLKGIQHVDDARHAVAAGMDGIVVSNHGGRQVDGAVGALDVLPEIAAAVGDRIEVLFDSGVRTGADVIKALALGARAVLVGRPYVYGLAHAGEDGVRQVLRGLLADLDLTLGLSGNTTPGALTASVLRRS